VSNAVDKLVEKFGLKREDYFIFVRNQYRFLENLRLEFRFIKSDNDSSKLLFRLEEELLKSLDFINIMTAYPLAIDLENDSYSLKRILSLIEYLENVVECMFIYEHEVVEESKRRENEPEDAKNEASEEPNSPYERRDSKEADDQYMEAIHRLSSKIKVRSTISIKKPGAKLKNEDSQYMAEL